MTGVVKNITDYGVFIDLGGIDGLLHITDISWGRVGHPSEYFEVGDEVDVVILKFDRDKERVSLGYKQRFEDPWTLVPEKYPIGKRVSGKVVSIVDYGAFVELEEGVEGLIHVSEMSWTKKVKNPRSMVDVDQEVEVVVSEVDPEKRRLSLSLRATEPNPWETVAETYTIGSEIHGIVRNLTDFGAFVEIVPGVDGLVHISDMSWTRRIQHPSDVVQKGQEIDAVITSIDVVNQRISLSMKELMPNEWEEYANSHRVGDETRGTVTNITDFGLFIELAPGVEGLCHVSEIDRDPSQSLADEYAVGQEVRCRILRIDWNDNRIGLSMHGISQQGEGAEEPTDAAAEPAAAAASAAEAAASASQTAMAQALARGGVIAGEPETATEEAAEEPAEATAEASEEPDATAEPETEAEPEEPTPEASEEPEGAEDSEAAEAAAEEDAGDGEDETDVSDSDDADARDEGETTADASDSTPSGADEESDQATGPSEASGDPDDNASQDLLKELEDQVAIGRRAPEDTKDDA
jgi:ribosomal protein S1